jgi:hypothetical protein
VVPQGLEEGSRIEVPGQELGLVTGEKVAFRLFSSNVRAGDVPGTMISNAVKELEETSGIETELAPVSGRPGGELLPIRLEGAVTDVGTLQLWLSHPASGQRWDLEFNVRATP